MRTSSITEIRCREVLDSKGRPTVETDVLTSDGAKGTASAPCGTSVGHAEAHALRDGGPRLQGLGTRLAVRQVLDKIAPVLLGKDVTEQESIDRAMVTLDGTPRKDRLGANAIYSVSVAVARAAAGSLGIPLYRYLAAREVYTLPLPAFNVLNGGVYGDRRVETQEFLWLPGSARSYREALEAGVSLFYELPGVLRREFGVNSVRMGHSAGYAAPANDPDALIRAILDAAGATRNGESGRIALDLAAGQFYTSERDAYTYLGRDASRNDILRYLRCLARKYPVLFVEDPLYEDDFDGFAEATGVLGPVPFVVGDDLYAMDIQRLEAGSRLGSSRALVFKPNMVGTVTEAMDVAAWAKAHGYLLIPSIRSGSNADDPIADFSVAVGAELMKPGALRSGERVACHNRLLQIEEELGASARFPCLSDITERFTSA